MHTYLQLIQSEGDAMWKNKLLLKNTYAESQSILRIL